METNRNKTSLVAISLLSIMLGSLLVPIGPVRAQFAATVDIVDKATGLSDIPAQADGTMFTVQLRIRDADDMDAYDGILNYYTRALDVLELRYSGCGGYHIQSMGRVVDDIGDGIRGQIGLGEAYAVLPVKGFTGSCVLAEIDFAVATGAFANGWSTMIHISSFIASSVKQLGADTVKVSMPIGILIDAHYGPSSSRYVDLLASPIRKRCIIEAHHYRWSLSRDGGDGKLSFDCTLVAYGNAYTVVARVKVTIIDQTINAIFGPYFSDEVQFFSTGESAIVRVDKGAESDDNNDFIIDIQVGHSYLVNAEAVYDNMGTTFLDGAGLNDRVFVFTVRA